MKAPKIDSAVIDWPPWLDDVMDTAVPVLVAIFAIIALHFGLKRERERQSTDKVTMGNGLLLALLWGGPLPAAILLWVAFG
jgi:hypothetical protein